MDTKNKILNSAAIEFARCGYRNATVRRICKNANTNVALVKYHFNGKEGLYKEVLDYLYNRIDFGIMIPLDFSSDEKWWESLYNWILAFLNKITNKSPFKAQFHKILEREMMEPSELFSEFYNKYFSYVVEDLRKIIVAQIGDTEDEELVNILIFSVIGQCLFMEHSLLISEVLGEKDYLGSKISLKRIAQNITDGTYLTIKKNS